MCSLMYSLSTNVCVLYVQQATIVIGHFGISAIFWGGCQNWPPKETEYSSWASYSVCFSICQVKKGTGSDVLVQQNVLFSAEVRGSAKLDESEGSCMRCLDWSSLEICDSTRMGGLRSTLIQVFGLGRGHPCPDLAMGTNRSKERRGEPRAVVSLSSPTCGCEWNF